MTEQVLCTRLSNGVLIPQVSAGTWQLKTGDPQTTVAINAALSCGYRGIDTAWAYENEEILGQLLQEFDVNKRDLPGKGRSLLVPLSKQATPDHCVIATAEEFKDNFKFPHDIKPTDDREIFVTTKIWVAYFTPEGIESQVREHLEKFNRNTADLVLLHWPGIHMFHQIRPWTEADMQADQFETRKTCWLKLEQLYWDKKIRAIGVCNYLYKHLSQLCNWISERKAAGDSKALYPMLNQIELSLFLQPSPDLVKLCRDRNIKITSHSTLGSSAHAAVNFTNPVLVKIASKYHDENNNPITPAAIMQRWSIESGYGVLPKSSNPQRIRDNLLNCLYRVQLSDEDMAELNALNANRRALPSPDDIG